MKKISLAYIQRSLGVVGLIVFLNVIGAQGQVMFQKTYGSTGIEGGYYIDQTSDSGYIIVGYAHVSANRIYLARTDVNGNLLWAKTYGYSHDAVGLCVQQTTDGGFIIGGATTVGIGSFDALFIKTDSSGNIQWNKIIGNLHSDDIRSLKQTLDGGYIFTGSYDGTNGGITKVRLIKTDSLGDTLWTRALGTLGGYESATSIQLTPDGGFIITGASTTSGMYDVILIKADSIGNPIWAKTYGGPNDDIGWDVQNTNDGGYIITGMIVGTNYGDVYLIKTDSFGDTLWTKAYGSPSHEYGTSVRQTADGGYIVFGNTYSTFPSQFSDIYMIKTDSLGDTLWTKTILISAFSDGLYGLKTFDEGYAIATNTNNLFQSQDLELLLIKTDSLGNSGGCNIGNTATTISSPTTQIGNPTTIIFSGSVITSALVGTNTLGTSTNLCTGLGINPISISNFPISISPNPFTDQLTITNPKNEEGEIVLYDIAGRVVARTFLPTGEVRWGLQLSSGMYLYEVRSGSGMLKKGKIVKQ